MLLCVLLGSLHARAQVPGNAPQGADEAAAGTDTLVVSLLTCAPGTESYALYGHTALRIVHPATGEDWVFNYGIFSFAQPHFAWRFMLGQTDYTVAAQRFPDFAADYAAAGRSITEQRLALRPEEARRLAAAVVRNVTTEGWTYRYNFLTDNCTSRVVRMIQESLSGRLVLPERTPTTYRSIIDAAAAPSPWLRFGQDLILGAAVDTAVGAQGSLVFPLLAMDILRGATVVEADGSRRPLVTAEHVVVHAVPQEARPFPLSPMAAALFVLLAALGVSLPDFRGARHGAGGLGCRGARLFDYTAMLVQGGAGCIVTLLLFFSQQPAVDSNRLFVLLNPLPLVWLPVKARRERQGLADAYVPTVQLLLVVLCLVASFFQKFPPEIYVLALALLIRSISARHARQKTRHAAEAQHRSANTENKATR